MDFRDIGLLFSAGAVRLGSITIAIWVGYEALTFVTSTLGSVSAALQVLPQ